MELTFSLQNAKQDNPRNVFHFPRRTTRIFIPGRLEPRPTSFLFKFCDNPLPGRRLKYLFFINLFRTSYHYPQSSSSMVEFANSKRIKKITWASVFRLMSPCLHFLHVSKSPCLHVSRIPPTENRIDGNGNGKIPFVCCKLKRKFAFLSQQTITGN
jgi:hypothetical protein